MKTDTSGSELLLHVKVLDEELTGQDLEELVKEQEKIKGKLPRSQTSSQKGINFGLPQKQSLLFTKRYSWSSPFVVSEVS